MILNLLNVVAKDENEVQFEINYEGNVIKNRMGVFSIIEKEPSVLTILHSKNKEITIKGSTRISLDFPCDRCLDPVIQSIHVEFEKNVNLSNVANDEHMIEERSYIDGYNLDVDKLLYNEILIGWPMKILCCEDCKGTCNVCGQNLNEGTCNCEDTGIDPRMSVIRDVFKNFKEV